MKNSRLTGLSALLLISLNYGCTTRTQVLLVEDSPVPSQHPHTLQRVASDIHKGGVYAGWEVKKIEPGHIVATTTHGSQSVVVDILFTGDAYNIIYKDSRNFDHKDNHISPRYNRWVLRLDRAIRKALLNSI